MNLSKPVEEQQRVLDRLTTSLEAEVSPEIVQRALTLTSLQESRRCSLTHEVMLWIVLGRVALITMILLYRC